MLRCHPVWQHPCLLVVVALDTPVENERLRVEQAYDLRSDAVGRELLHRHRDEEVHVRS